MRFSGVDETLNHHHQWLRHELPFENRLIETDRARDGGAEQLTRRIRLLAADAAHVAHEIHDAHTARRLLQVLGLMVGSVERHAQAYGRRPGEGLATLGVEDALTHLGRVASHTPRDSHYTYWLDNVGSAPLTFTGSLQETGYVHIIDHTHQLHSVAAMALRSLTIDVWTVQSALQAVRFAADAEERLSVLYREFLAHVDDARAEFFHVHWPSYLVSYPVGGEMTHGPNPHHLATSIELELLVGDHDDSTRAMHVHHLPHLTLHDRKRVEGAARATPVAQRLLETAGLADTDLHTMTAQAVADHLMRRPWLHELLIAFEHITATIDANRSHLAAIHDAMHLHPRDGHPAYAGELNAAVRLVFDAMHHISQPHRLAS